MNERGEGDDGVGRRRLIQEERSTTTTTAGATTREQWRPRTASDVQHRATAGRQRRHLKRKVLRCAAGKATLFRDSSDLCQVLDWGGSEAGGYLLIAQSLLTESSKIRCPESCFFFDPSEVPLYRTYVLCTQGRRNISLIGRTAVGSLSVFEWVET